MPVPFWCSTAEGARSRSRLSPHTSSRARRCCCRRIRAGTARPVPRSSPTFPTLAATYLRLLADRDLHDVLVIGSSLGGWIAAEMAASDTDHRIGRLVIIDGAGVEVPGEPVVDFFDLTPRQIAEHSWHDPERGFVDPSTLPPERIAAQRANIQTMGVYTGHARNARSGPSGSDSAE